MYGGSYCRRGRCKEWIDIVVANYGSAAYPIGQMTKKQCSGISMEFNLGGGGSLSASKAQSMIDGGYGWFMGFAPSPAKYGSVFSRLQGGGEVLYGSNVAAPTIFYKKMIRRHINIRMIFK